MISEREKLAEIIRIDSELNKIQDVDILLERILLEARKSVNADAGTIYIRDGKKLVMRYSQNNSKQKELPPGQKLIYSTFSVPISKKTISGYVAATGEMVNIDDVYKISSDAPYGFNPSYDNKSGYRTQSTLTIPLESNTGGILGVIQIINAMGKKDQIIPFDTDDELFISHFASSATLTLQRAQLTREILLRMIRMAELRDPKETGAHVNRVAAYSVEIYERWAFKNKVREHEFERNRDILRMAAMLHDVGKVAISDLILKKPGRFTEEEYECMKQHSYLGARLFMDSQSEFDEVAAEVALSHHENWDGSGYPGYIDLKTGQPVSGQHAVEQPAKGQHAAEQPAQSKKEQKAPGMKGKEIPLWGRIVAMADVYDALSCRRVYKEAWKEEDVLKEIRACSGTKFEPQLVDLFFEALPSIKQIQELYPDSD